MQAPLASWLPTLPQLVVPFWSRSPLRLVGGGLYRGRENDPTLHRVLSVPYWIKQINLWSTLGSKPEIGNSVEHPTRCWYVHTHEGITAVQQDKSRISAGGRSSIRGALL